MQLWLTTILSYYILYYVYINSFDTDIIKISLNLYFLTIVQISWIQNHGSEHLKAFKFIPNPNFSFRKEEADSYLSS